MRLVWEGFFGIDKLSEKFEHLSPFQYANNTPSFFIDKNGEYISIYLGTGENRQELRYNNKNNKFYYHGGDNDGKEYSGKNKFVASVNEALIAIETGGEEGEALVSFLADNENNQVEIARSKGGNFARSSGKAIGFNPSSKNGGLDEEGNTSRPSFIGLAHEMDHIQDSWNGTQDDSFWFFYKKTNKKTGKKYTTSKTFKEVYASFVENKIRKENGLPLRAYYSPTVNSKTRITGSRALNEMLKNLASKIISVQPKSKFSN